MMRIAVINPNSTVSMTEKVAAAARVVEPAAEIRAITCHGAPPAIQGPADGLAATPFLLAAVRQAAADGADAAIIACFDDAGLAEARAAVTIPVLGIGEAVFHAAMLLGHRYSVMTTLAVSVPVITKNLRDYGLASHTLQVRASDVAVLDLERAGSDARSEISAEIGRAVALDGAGAIVLGCAGMADLAAALDPEHHVPVIDGVAAATAFAAALIRIRKMTP